jgi:acetoin utilization deacetylase AcuC-like enzyme
VHAFQRLVIPALERFKPDLIIVASGLDANGVDPLARMLLHSETYRTLTGMMLEVAERLCGGRLVGVHEGTCRSLCAVLRSGHS